VYEVGIADKARPAMYDANVRGTERVLRDALTAGVGRVVYVSTVATFGNTGGAVVDESHEHPGTYTSYYEETKHQAHEIAVRLCAEGLQCVIVQPGAVYGPGDHSQLGNLLDQLLKGRLPLIALGGAGLTLVHRDDVAAGIVLALDKGKAGESYVLGGHVGTLREFVDTAARVAGRSAPRIEVPSGVLRAVAPLGPVIGPVLGYPPNMRELVSSADGVTFWATDAKARRELGYTTRSLEQGLRDTLVADGRLPA
jgi:nucleoside-diphosphate-sugar epimerase